MRRESFISIIGNTRKVSGITRGAGGDALQRSLIFSECALLRNAIRFRAKERSSTCSSDFYASF